jgi:ribosomal protein S18 acetylase RimI-like enzyme
MSWSIRDAELADAADIDRVALAAFSQYRDLYDNWPAFSRNIGRMSRLDAELIVAADGARIGGAVGYVAPSRPSADFFEPDWPVIRMLSVDPAARGAGLGRRLTEACVARARRDGAPVIALHTSPIQKVARAMYLRMGFEERYPTPPIYGVPYAVYLKALD